jgi:hypothetical protein
MSPPFRKFLREVLVRKVKFEDQQNVTLYEKSSAIRYLLHNRWDQHW